MWHPFKKPLLPMAARVLLAPFRLILVHAPWPTGLGATTLVEACARATGVPEGFWHQHPSACASLVDGRAERAQRLAMAGLAMLCGWRTLWVTLDCISRTGARFFAPPGHPGPPAERDQ